jgi:two-component system capsular synthesis sensor histidine kinase RcsC
VSNKLSEISLLKCYQQRLILWGGLGLSLALLCGAFFVIWADVQSYVADGRAVYVANKALITQELEKRRAAMQRDVIYSELLWSRLDKVGSVRISVFKAG